MIQFNIWP